MKWERERQSTNRASDCRDLGLSPKKVALIRQDRGHEVITTERSKRVSRGWTLPCYDPL